MVTVDCDLVTLFLEEVVVYLVVGAEVGSTGEANRVVPVWINIVTHMFKEE